MNWPRGFFASYMRSWRAQNIHVRSMGGRGFTHLWCALNRKKSSMPLVVMCGLPCSGKTQRVEQLVQFIKENYDKEVQVHGRPEYTRYIIRRPVIVVFSSLASWP